MVWAKREATVAEYGGTGCRINTGLGPRRDWWRRLPAYD
jgi:hypothetical protein